MNTLLTFLLKYWYIPPTTVIVILLLYIFYKNFRRITSVSDLPSNMYGIYLTGIVTYIPDGDTFRFYHTPLFRSSTLRFGIKTLNIRIAGMDAPEGKYFGGEGQPLHNKSQKFLSDLIHLNKVKIKLLKTDRYNRILAVVYITKWLFKVNVAYKMLEKGMACVYIGSDAVYDNKKEKYIKKENIAKRKKLGIWGLKNYESPMDYKKRMRAKKKSSK
ncbi:hypothetical protein SLOPH_2662 [Spraguea lophii 42_110]|uniref:TNase-like domain-containing protein n=1 Tax=Spraguea lophii (strain 42_110) TaxID=1358809 RepID=S7W655_SPRLO|nr:hypothetical protein SLOPH_2662 [Spraguea lophii 42_110]